MHIGSIPTMTYWILNIERFCFCMLCSGPQKNQQELIYLVICHSVHNYSSIPCYLFMTYLGKADYDCKDGQTRRGEKICGMLIESRWSTTFFFFIYSKQRDGKMSMHAPHLQKIDAWKGMGMMIFPHYWGKTAAFLKFCSSFSQLGLPSIVKFLSNLQHHLSHSTKKVLC